MAKQCLMAFGPMGVIRNKAILESLKDAPRWSGVVMSEKVAIRPADEVAVLAYKAEGERGSGKPYLALCTSTYIRQDGGWKIAQHQQTPL